MQVRVQKLIAESGICSRRKAEELIKEKRVKVNGKTITIGDTAEAKDKISVDNVVLEKEPKKYYKFYKPKGYITTMGDEKKSIKELIKTRHRLFPVGRLDKDAEGLLIITNDGEFANKIMHPRYTTKKEYEVLLDSPLQNKIEKMKIEGRDVEISKMTTGKKVRITIHEGRKHIVKKVFQKLGKKVLKLKRIRINNTGLDNMKPGEMKQLTEKEINNLSKTFK